MTMKEHIKCVREALELGVYVNDTMTGKADYKVALGHLDAIEAAIYPADYLCKDEVPIDNSLKKRKIILLVSDGWCSVPGSPASIEIL